MTDFHAYTPASREPVRTFNDQRLAEAYQRKMAKFGCAVTIRPAKVQRRAA